MKALKAIILTALISCYMVGLSAQQSGMITYSEVTKLDIKGIAGLDLGDMMPNEISAAKALFFDQSSSVYMDTDDHVSEDIELESDDGSFQMVLSTSDDTEDILFTNLKDKKSLHQTGFMGKEFLIESDIEKAKWKITDERIKYLGFVCQKAILTETVPATPGDDTSEPTEREVVAWFTPEIPLPIGPGDYHQLPGAVLLVSVDDGKRELKATSVDFDYDVSERLGVPTKGQRVTANEYRDIIAQKMKELQEINGNREGSSSTFIFRG